MVFVSAMAEELASRPLVMATGYQPNYMSFLQADSIDPLTREARKAGLYVVGFCNRVTGLLHEICKEALIMANEIAQRRSSAAR
jgi:hypothetical protein